MPAHAYHIPVMAEAAVALLAAAPAGPLVDATAGGGGHLVGLAQATGPERPLVGVDQDPEALAATRARLAEEGVDPARVTLLHGNFGDLPAVLAGGGVDVDHGVAGILADLGVSSHQLDEPARGFAFKHGGAPLDMRMDATSDGPTAAELLRAWSADELARVLRELGEVPQAGRVARAIKRAVDEERMDTTGDLARAVEAVQKARRHVHPATTVFQALRIAVNGELDALDALLEAAPGLLKAGGRLAVIAYHSLEDRRVKQAFRRGAEGPDRPRHLPPPSDWRPTWEPVTRKALQPSEAEVAANPRARSARLRAAARAPLARRGDA